MKYATLTVRILLGLIFTIFGLNGFFQFLPMPPLPEESMKFMGGLMAAPYFFPVLKTTEVVSGLLLLSGLYVPLALTVLAPIVLNIFLFHLFLAPGGLPLAILLVVLELSGAYLYRDRFRGVLSMK